jgi:TPR repeat protein
MKGEMTLKKTKAIELYKKAIEIGDAQGMNNLAISYENGDEV